MHVTCAKLCSSCWSCSHLLLQLRHPGAILLLLLLLLLLVTSLLRSNIIGIIINHS
jgi:hypothetical protein